MKRWYLLALVIFLFSYLNITPQQYPIVDTGQETTYDSVQAISPPQPGDPFHGQDAQIDGNQPSYTISNDGLTVYDNVTGLTWIKKPDTDNDGDLDTYDQLTWTEFKSYPETLNAQNFGGYNDWRTPTIKELYSLIDFRGTDPDPSATNTSDLTPFIDTDYFDFVYGDTSVGERIIDAQYWSSTEYLGTTMGGNATVFGVNFADGRIKGYPRDIGPGGIADHYARYVRGNTSYGINDYVDNSDGTIRDNATGLLWTKDDFGDGSTTGPRSGMKWEDAFAFVQQKNSESYLGYNDWRLPNAKEMQSILDYSSSPDSTGSAAIDPIFNVTEITNEGGHVDYPWYWTGTSHVRFDGNAESGVYICFGRSMGYWQNEWTDVHGAGAQRGDRKGLYFTGLSYIFDGYYFPIAPQGDATRILNYIRLVRGGSTTDVGDVGKDIPKEFKFEQNYPNPFNPSTTISFTLPTDSEVSLKIFNLIGQEVETLVSDDLSAGSYSYNWNAENIPSGMYLYKLDAGSYSTVKKMTLIK